MSKERPLIGINTDYYTPARGRTPMSVLHSGHIDSVLLAGGLPVIIPPQEVQALRKEFFTQISYLFQVMRKVDNRGFMFRLDFNGYLSALANEIATGAM